MSKALLDQPSLGISEFMCSCVPWFYWVFQLLVTKNPQQRQAHCWGIRPASLWVCVCGDKKRPVACFFQQCWSDLWRICLGLPFNANLLEEPCGGPHRKSTTSLSSDNGRSVAITQTTAIIYCWMSTVICLGSLSFVTLWSLTFWLILKAGLVVWWFLFFSRVWS